MKESKIIYSCLEHCEMAIDEYVNSYEEAPCIDKISGKKCNFCQKEAAYKIFSSKDDN
jgi:CxxH/CxxC protein (TIGR04129 family)